MRRRIENIERMLAADNRLKTAHESKSRSDLKAVAAVLSLVRISGAQTVEWGPT
jgi:hypothetical protein